jgi:hypothetical protein
MSIKRFMKWYYIVPLAIVAAPVLIALFVLLGGGVVMLLWNWLLPPLFDLPRITLLQGFGLLMLCRILFGGFGGGGGGGHHKHRCKSPEDREQFRDRMRERFAGRTADAEAKAGPTTSESQQP